MGGKGRERERKLLEFIKFNHNSTFYLKLLNYRKRGERERESIDQYKFTSYIKYICHVCAYSYAH